MRKNKKILKIFSIIFALLVILLIVIYKSPIGENLLKNYISSKLSMLKQFNIESFTYKLNSFSLILKKGSNYIYVYGDLFPFDASYEANFNDLSEISNSFKGETQSKGIMKYKNATYIKGNALFANGYGELDFKCKNKCEGNFSGSDFSLEKLLYMINVKFPYLKGQVDLSVFLKKNILVNYDFLGDLSYKNLLFKNVKIKGRGDIVNKDNYILDLKVFHPMFEGNLTLKNKKNNIFYKGKTSVYLSALTPITFFPLKGKKLIDFMYDESSGIFKFSSCDFSGYKIKNEINVQLDKLSFKRFFELIGVNDLADGKISGNVVIKNRGEFDLMANNFKVLNNSYISYIERVIKKRIKFFRVMFLKGYFDDKRVIFNFLAKNEGIILSIQKGVYEYNDDVTFKVEVIANNTKYIFLVRNGKIRLYKKAKSFKLKEEILVY